MTDEKLKSNRIGIFIITVVLVLFILSVLILILQPDIDGPGLITDNKIGVVEITGILKESKDITDQLHRFQVEDSIKGVVVRVNSPGGAVGPAQEIYEEIEKIRAEKRVVVSMGTVAASGGYYVSSSADRIFANPGTITGSIGVILHFSHIEEIMDKFGWRHKTVKSAELKDAGSPFRSPSEKDITMFEEVIGSIHQQFIEHIAYGRGLSIEMIKEVADGRLLSGQQALELGLIDELGGFHSALEWIAEDLGIEEEPHLVYPKKVRRGWIEYLFREVMNRIGSGDWVESLLLMTPVFETH